MTENVLCGYISEEGFPNIPVGKKIQLPDVTADRCAELYTILAADKGEYGGKPFSFWRTECQKLLHQENLLRKAWLQLFESGFKSVMFETGLETFVIISKRNDQYYRTTFDKHGPLSDKAITKEEICDINAGSLWVY